MVFLVHGASGKPGYSISVIDDIGHRREDEALLAARSRGR
jgi:hypothetical protein